MNIGRKSLRGPLIRSVAFLLFAAGGAAAEEPAAPAVKAPAKSTAQAEAGEPRANTGTSPGTGQASKPAGQKGPAAADHVALGTATVTGEREQPKVMYIVPWKRADIGDLSGKPMNSLLDEALAPVDRDEFKREVAYFDAVNSQASQNGAGKPAPAQVER